MIRISVKSALKLIIIVIIINYYDLKLEKKSVIHRSDACGSSKNVKVLFTPVGLCHYVYLIFINPHRIMLLL